MSGEYKIYRYNDDISFRKCSLFSGEMERRGDCTSFSQSSRKWITYYSCNNNGIHFHCTRHPAIEMDYISDDYFNKHLICPRCNKEIQIDNLDVLTKKCLKVLNMELFRDAKLIRLDDWYIPEVKKKEKIESAYWISTDVKKDRDGDTIIIIYVGHNGKNEKVQYFIKPEKLQLASDHKDMDPAKIISKIEVTLKDRTLKQEYDT